MSEENNNEETVVPGSDAQPGEGDANVDIKSLSLESINKELGRDFKTIEDAQKGISDTFKFVGKAGNYQSAMKQLQESLGMDESDVMKHLIDSAKVVDKPKEGEEKKSEVNTDDFISREQYDRDMFYKNNPQYESMKSLINDMAKAQGITPTEVIELDTFKDIYAKVDGFDKTQNKKSVLESNPRLNAAKDKVTNAKVSVNEAAKARATGDIGKANQLEIEARGNAIGAVMDTFEIGDES